MRWSTFETPEGQKISIDMDELVAVINYPGDKADLCLKNGTLHTVIFMGQWKPDDRPLPDWDPEILRSEIQDLKLENDLLKRRDEIMLKFIRSVACINCNDSCVFYDKPGCIASVLDNSAYSLNHVFKSKAEECLQELDNL